MTRPREGATQWLPRVCQLASLMSQSSSLRRVQIVEEYILREARKEDASLAPLSHLVAADNLVSLRL